MPLIVPQDTAVTFMTGFNSSKSLFEGGCHAQLPGVEAFNNIARCDPRIPEEMAAWYDDMRHDVQIWCSLYLQAMTDRCTFTSPLF